ncbi:hypothetical protein CFB49_07500 [Burkholderia sp. AU17457]|nr:hypothetical protein CFB49_07500 [Burkholderia sp. AU17457]
MRTIAIRIVVIAASVRGHARSCRAAAQTGFHHRHDKFFQIRKPFTVWAFLLGTDVVLTQG